MTYFSSLHFFFQTRNPQQTFLCVFCKAPGSATTILGLDSTFNMFKSQLKNIALLSKVSRILVIDQGALRNMSKMYIKPWLLWPPYFHDNVKVPQSTYIDIFSLSCNRHECQMQQLITNHHHLMYIFQVLQGQNSQQVSPWTIIVSGATVSNLCRIVCLYRLTHDAGIHR